MFGKTRTQKRRLTDEQIQKLRHSYYVKLENMNTLAKRHDISKSLVQRIVHYELYKDVPNLLDITEELIENRKPARQTIIGSKTLMKQHLISQEMERKRAIIQRSKEDWDKWEREWNR